jgi:hypothetical protein
MCSGINLPAFRRNVLSSPSDKVELAYLIFPGKVETRDPYRWPYTFLPDYTASQCNCNHNIKTCHNCPQNLCPIGFLPKCIIMSVNCTVIITVTLFTSLTPLTHAAYLQFTSTTSVTYTTCEYIRQPFHGWPVKKKTKVWPCAACVRFVVDKVV